MKLFMVAASLAGGGAERALLDTALLMKERGHDVTVLTFEEEASDAYLVPAGVSRMTLRVPGRSGNRLQGLFNNLRRIIRLRAEVCRLQPDVVVSYLTRTNLICLIALFGTGRPVVATEHNVAALNDAPMQVVWRGLRRVLYPYMAQVVVVSNGLARQYAWLDADKLSVIHNFLPATRGTEQETFDFLSRDVRYLVAMGRLESEKRFDLLIEAFQLVEKDCSGWNLLIVGEGSLRPSLMHLISSLGMTERIALPGRVSNPRTLFRQCDLFVLSSESEGFGLVLLEAMSAGLPVISFDCDFGPREIITHNFSGILVSPGNVLALSDAIRTLIQNGAVRDSFAQHGLLSVSRFAPKEILDRWEAMLRQVAAANSAPRDRLSTPAGERS